MICLLLPGVLLPELSLWLKFVWRNGIWKQDMTAVVLSRILGWSRFHKTIRVVSPSIVSSQFSKTFLLIYPLICYFSNTFSKNVGENQECQVQEIRKTYKLVCFCFVVHQFSVLFSKNFQTTLNTAQNNQNAIISKPKLIPFHFFLLFLLHFSGKNEQYNKNKREKW